MANVSSATNFFPTAQEGFTTTTSGTVASAATSVGLNSVAGYTNGDVITLVIDPTDAAKKQVFTGVVDTSGTQITGVVWTEGTNQTHTAGSTVVDYETATAWALYSKGLLVSHDQDGTLKDDNVTTAKIADDAVTATKIDWASTGADGGIWWEELGRTTLGSTGDVITVSSFPARTNLKVLIYTPISSGNDSHILTFNGDTSTNYAISTSENFGAVSTGVSQTGLRLSPSSGASSPLFTEMIIQNTETTEKMGIAFNTHRGSSGAATAPGGRITRFKWVNTADQITTIAATNNGSGDFSAGSYVIVLGHN